MRSRRKKGAFAFLSVLIYPGVELYKQLSGLLNNSSLTLLSDRVSEQEPLEVLANHFCGSPTAQRQRPAGCALCQAVLCARLLWHAALDPCGNAVVISSGGGVPVTHNPCCDPWLCFFNISCAGVAEAFLLLDESCLIISLSVFPHQAPYIYIFCFRWDL